MPRPFQRITLAALLAASLGGCAAPNALSDDEDVLPGPEVGAWSASGAAPTVGDTDGDTAGSGGGTGGTETGDAIPLLTVERVDVDTVTCDHRGITAPCGELRSGSAVWSDTVRVMRVSYVLVPDGSGETCAWDSAYTLDGVGPDAGTVVAGVVLDDGTPVAGTETSSTFTAASR
jgi:hypothetical protein